MANDDMILSFIEGDKSWNCQLKDMSLMSISSRLKGSLIHQIRIANGL